MKNPFGKKLDSKARKESRLPKITSRVQFYLCVCVGGGGGGRAPPPPF